MKKSISITLCLVAIVGMLFGPNMVVLADCNESGHEFYTMQQTVTTESNINTHTHYDSARDQLYSCTLVRQNVTILKRCRNCGYTFSEFTQQFVHISY